MTGGRPETIEMTQEKNNAFCVIPWVQFYIAGAGKIMPCCHASTKYPLGWFEGQSTPEILNSPAFRKLRAEFMQGKQKESLCSGCYFMEGLAGNSARKEANRIFAQEIPNLIASTEPDGNLRDPKLLASDVRFSNLCNFTCIMCDSTYSSSWERKLGEKTNSILFFEDAKFDHITKNLNSLQRIHFAGGEPLLIENHYRVLELLIERKKTDIQLSYNTNFSKISLGQKSVIDLWAHFAKVDVMASLDEVDERAQYLRKGSPWSRIVENILTVKKACPHVNIFANVTSSNMNIFRIPEILSTFWSSGIVSPVTNFCCDNILYEPEPLNVSSVPSEPRLRELVRLREFRMSSEAKFGVSFPQLDIIENLLLLPYQPAKQPTLEYLQEMDAILGGSFQQSLPELVAALQS